VGARRLVGRQFTSFRHFDRKQFIIAYGITRSVALQAGIAKGTPGIRFPSCSTEKASHLVPLLLLGIMLSFAPTVRFAGLSRI
jgi:hypothetical protein